MASWFEQTISKHDQYEVSKAKAEIAFHTHLACLTARNIVRIIRVRFGPNAA